MSCRNWDLADTVIDLCTFIMITSCNTNMILTRICVECELCTFVKCINMCYSNNNISSYLILVSSFDKCFLLVFYSKSFYIVNLASLTSPTLMSVCQSDVCLALLNISQRPGTWTPPPPPPPDRQQPQRRKTSL